MSDLQTAGMESTGVASAAATIALPLVLVADADGTSRARRADELRDRGFRVTVARTPFEAIVKASCHLPDLILVDSSLMSGAAEGAEETAQLLATCPATAHIPIIRINAGRRLPARVFAVARA
jgi:CheY-like chemotaxis protein